MILALDQMDPTVQGILFLVAVVIFAVAALASERVRHVNLVAAGLAVFSFVFMWNAFAAA